MAEPVNKTDFFGRDTAVNHPYFDPHDENESPENIKSAAELLGIILNFINRGKTPNDQSLRFEIVLFYVRPDLSRHGSLEDIGRFSKPDPTGKKSGASRQHVHDISNQLFQFIPSFKSLNRKPNKSHK